MMRILGVAMVGGVLCMMPAAGWAEGGHDHTSNSQTTQHTADRQGATPADQEAATVYTCPMHPEVRQAEPGQCPMCGMTLTETAPEAAQDHSASAPMESPAAAPNADGHQPQHHSGHRH